MADIPAQELAALNWRARKSVKRLPAFESRRQTNVARVAVVSSFRTSGPKDELKFHDLDIDDASIAAAGTIAEDNCVEIAQGTTESTRIGRKAVVRRISWRYEIILASQTVVTTTSETVRVILYQDKQCNGATATPALILASDDYQAFNLISNKNRFKILFDRLHVLKCPSGSGRGTTDTLAFGEDRIRVQMFLKKLNIPIEYDNSVTTGDIASIRSNCIGVLLLSQTGALTSLLSKMRIRFTDN